MCHLLIEKLDCNNHKIMHMKALISNQGRVFTTALKALPVALLMAGMSSCSDDINNGVPEGGDNSQASDLQSYTLDVFTSPSSMPASVINYTWGKPGSRSLNPDINLAAVLEEAQQVDMGALAEYNPNIFYYNPDGADTGKLVIHGDYTGALQNFGSTVYVLGKWTITGFNANTYLGKTATIVVLPGGELCLSNDGQSTDNIKFQGNNCLTIFNFGKLTTTAASDKMCDIEGVTLYSATALDQIKRLGFQSEVFIDGAVDVDYIHISGNSDVYINCKLEATEKVVFDNDQTFHVGYIKSPCVEIMAKPTVVLRDGAYIETDFMFIHNAQSSQIYAKAEDVALIKAGKIQVNNVGDGNLRGTFGNLNLICDTWIYGENIEPTKEGLGLNASVNWNEEVDVVFEEDTTPGSCAPKFVTIPPEPTDKPHLETIATVTNDHSHPISATCIQFAGNKAYMSWHARGEGIQGCIEVLEHTAEGIKLIAYAQDHNTDYNHIIVDGDRLLATGHNAQHALIGEIALTGGTFETGATINYTHLKGNRVSGEDNPEFYGGDGNCIVRNGDYITVASYGGFHTLTSDLKRLNGDRDGAVRTPGSGKHLSLVGDKLITLNLLDRDPNATALPAELRLYSADDYYWANPTVIATDLEVSPIDGKNTIALDTDGSMYVALGHGGLKKFNAAGALVAEFKAGETKRNPANGLAVDDKYLYVAFGSGLYIFDKTDLSKPVVTYANGKPGATKYAGNTEEDGVNASCNYVAVDGDIIYLAYGRNGVDVLRMTNR